MKNVALAFKVLTLLGAFALLTWSSIPAPADASAAVTCWGTGHNCHVTEEGTTYHHKDVASLEY